MGELLSFACDGREMVIDSPRADLDPRHEALKDAKPAFVGGIHYYCRARLCVDFI